MLGAGNLTEKLDFKRAERVQNASGGWVNSWNTILSTFGSVRELKTSNDFIASQSDLSETLEVVIRYRQDVILKKGDRLFWRGRELEIVGLPSGFIDRERIRILARMINETTDNG